MLGVVLAGCGDDDDSAPSTTAPVTTDVATTASTTTTSSTTTTTTTSPPTTTVDVEALKAQITGDYLKTAQAVEDLLRNPTLDGLDDKLTAIAVPGSYSFTSIRATVEDFVAKGQRAAPGDPDYSDSSVQSVEMVGDPASGEAVVTVCRVTNQKLVDATGQVVGGATNVTAVKAQEPMMRTADGWRQADQGTQLSIQENATTCAP
jgi:hypothetical protein